MNLCKLIDRTEYLLFALVLLPTFLVIGAAVVSLTDIARATESALWQSVAPSIDEDDSGVANTAGSPSREPVPGSPAGSAAAPAARA